ncbi:MAG: hypothetical protein EA402_12740 [Planctomycetota bacterium]|nr:MAG: hypothetical protein EA402_12740 [Planctomycetota bacterium]
MKRQTDAHLEALKQELRVTINELNLLHHPVYPGDPKRIREMELMVAELRQAIGERRALLNAPAPSTPHPG